MGLRSGEASQEVRGTPAVLPGVEGGDVVRADHQLTLGVTAPAGALLPQHDAVHLAAHRDVDHPPQLVLRQLGDAAVQRPVYLGHVLLVSLRAELAGHSGQGVLKDASHVTTVSQSSIKLGIFSNMKF